MAKKRHIKDELMQPDEHADATSSKATDTKAFATHKLPSQDTELESTSLFKDKVAGNDTKSNKKHPFLSYAQQRKEELGTVIERNRWAAIVALIIVLAVVAILAFAYSHTRQLPDDDYIINDAASRISAPNYDPGLYGREATFTTDDAHVVSKQRTEQAISSSDAQFGASAYAEAQVLVSYRSQEMLAQKTASLGYAQVNNVWGGIGAESNPGVSWHALEGVDQEKVLAQLPHILQQADKTTTSATPTGDPIVAKHAKRSLADIYDSSSKVQVVKDDFDEIAQSDSLELELKKTEGFISYHTNITITFILRPVNGVWEIEKIDVPNDAKDMHFDALLGEWTGQFQSQNSGGTKNLSARTQPLVLTIKQVRLEAGSIKIDGSVSGRAHFHKYPRRDTDSDPGDLDVSKQDFSALSSDSSAQHLHFTCTLPENVGGTLELALDFGSDTNPEEVVARLTSHYHYEENFLLFSTQKEAVYEDLYSLVKKPEAPSAPEPITAEAPPSN